MYCMYCLYCLYCLQYYPLDISFFKSSLDSHLLGLLWNKYWVHSLSSNPLLSTRDLLAGQLADIGGRAGGCVEGQGGASFFVGGRCTHCRRAGRRSCARLLLPHPPPPFPRNANLHPCRSLPLPLRLQARSWRLLRAR